MAPSGKSGGVAGVHTALGRKMQDFASIFKPGWWVAMDLSER
jgi:hypothetical protein